MELKCCPCTDDLITSGDTYPETAIPDAVTIAPVLQAFIIGGQQVTAPVMLPVCFSCRGKQMGQVSKQGLVTA